MADVSHELGSLRSIVDTPLSSKVAMFNNQAQQHKASQLLNPFSNADGGRCSPKPTFSKDQYGKPLAGSLTEMRGQKANMHVMREMLELCQIIDSEGYAVKDEPKMRVITFGELFNIYNYISDKCVGILLRARKYKLLEFEGEMLFQRRDDDVPIFLLKPILEIRHELDEKINEIKRASSPAPPQSTSVLMDKSAHLQKLKNGGSLSLPGSTRNSKSRSPSPIKTKGGSTSPANTKCDSTSPAPSPAPATEVVAETAKIALEKPVAEIAATVAKVITEVPAVTVEAPEALPQLDAPKAAPQLDAVATPTAEEPQPQQQQEQPPETPLEPVNATDDDKTDINNNNANTTVAVTVATTAEMPTIVIEASAEYVQGATSETETVAAAPETTAAVSAENVAV